MQASGGVNEWIDGFLFVANYPILDLLEYKAGPGRRSYGTPSRCERSRKMVDCVRNGEFGQG